VARAAPSGKEEMTPRVDRALAHPAGIAPSAAESAVGVAPQTTYRIEIS